MQLSMLSSDALQQLPLEALEQRCAAETQHYFKQQPSDPQYGHELLRRALLLHDERAWASLYQIYQPLVAGWLRQQLRWAVSELDWQTMLDDTFLRMRGAFARHPEKFNDYPNLNTLLGLLHRCSQRVVQDYVEQAKQQPRLAPLDENVATCPATDTTNTLLWARLEKLLQNEQEQLVVRYLFIEEAKPRHLYADHPHLFHDVNEINTIRERIKVRLRRNQEFYVFLQNMSEN
ncbi:MAG: hypothetical protein U0350_24750 [Caldilineaceae bacterium]